MALPASKSEGTLSRQKSFVIGKDKDVIPVLMWIHANENPRILDVTYSLGTMWKGLNYPIISMDKSLSIQCDVHADFGRLPFSDNSFDVIVYDPPHLPNHAASENSSLIWKTRYGITDDDSYGRDGDNVSGMFLPFLLEARRVLSDGGIILAKIADLTHNHKYQWQHVDFINEVIAAKLTPCDMIIKADPSAGNLQSSKWENVKHVRKAHCYWIVVRKGKCEK